MEKIINKVKVLEENKNNILISSSVAGFSLLSAGIWVIGSRINPSLGNILIIFGSVILYLSVIFFVLCS